MTVEKVWQHKNKLSTYKIVQLLLDYLEYIIGIIWVYRFKSNTNKPFVIPFILELKTTRVKRFLVSISLENDKFIFSDSKL